MGLERWSPLDCWYWWRCWALAPATFNIWVWNRPLDEAHLRSFRWSSTINGILHVLWLKSILNYFICLKNIIWFLLFNVSSTHEAVKGFVLSLDLPTLEATARVKLRRECTLIIHLVRHIKLLVCVKLSCDNLGLSILSAGWRLTQALSRIVRHWDDWLFVSLENKCSAENLVCEGTFVLIFKSGEIECLFLLHRCGETSIRVTNLYLINST